LLLTEIAVVYEQFWTGLSWQTEAPFQQVPNDTGFIDRTTGHLIHAYPDRLPSGFFNTAIRPPGRPNDPARIPTTGIIYPSIVPNSMTSVIANFSVIDRRPAMPNFRGLINDAVRQFAEYCPSEIGVQFSLPEGGVIWLNRGSSFLQFMGDDGDPAITRGVVGMELRGGYY